MMVRGKIPTMTLLAVGAAVTLAGCGLPDEQAPPPPTPAAAEPVASAKTTSSSPAPTSEQPTTTQPQPADRECTAGDLELSLGEGDSAAGTVYKPLWFKNVGEQECVVQGFPGVSYVGGDDGHQVGAPAFRDGTKGDPVTLGKGQSAFTDIGFVNIHNYDEAECRPEAVRGLRVYAPHETESEFVPFEGMGCASEQIQGNQLTVKTVTKG